VAAFPASSVLGDILHTDGGLRVLQPPHREAFNDEQMYWVDRYRLLVVSPPNHGTLGLSSIVGWPLILYLVDSVILSTFLLPVCL